MPGENLVADFTERVGTYVTEAGDLEGFTEQTVLSRCFSWKLVDL